MTKIWDGPTPFDGSIANLENHKHIDSLGILTLELRAAKNAWIASMNSPEVRAMYTKLHQLRHDPSVAEALAAYEAGLKETKD